MFHGNGRTGQTQRNLPVCLHAYNCAYLHADRPTCLQHKHKLGLRYLTYPTYLLPRYLPTFLTLEAVIVTAT